MLCNGIIPQWLRVVVLVALLLVVVYKTAKKGLRCALLSSSSTGVPADARYLLGVLCFASSESSYNTNP